MITRIECRNFQSLKKVDLDLDRLTVIVGASSSGKSALIRAFKAVASNLRGSSAITRGQKAAAITVRTEHHAVTLERTDSSGAYRIVDQQGQEHVYTKLAGGVPEHVTAALRIEPCPSNGTSLNFAGQFDKPYLLDDTGANVARSLGELTNVTTIFEAVRNANKARLAASSTLKTRKTDLAGLTASIGQYAGLSARLHALDNIERQANTAAALENAIDRLRHAMRTLEIAEQVLSRVQHIPDVPDDTIVDAALTRMCEFRALLAHYTQQRMNGSALQDRITAELDNERNLDAELTHLLHEAGTCPTCGQNTC